VGPSPRRRLSVTADLAKVTGVSHQAVSRVLNDHPDVSAVARTQVLRVIDQLGYRRNLVARALVTRTSRLTDWRQKTRWRWACCGPS
jgi:hypothetical protein